jgi:hypothetical protein
VADKILELREAKVDLELDDLNQVPYLRLTPQLCMCVCNNFYNGPDFYTGPLLSN